MGTELAVVQGTPDSTMGVEGTSLAKSVDKDGRPLPEGPVAAKHLKVTAPKPKKAAPMYIPQGPLKSKYHVQVSSLILLFGAGMLPLVAWIAALCCCCGCPLVLLLLPFDTPSAARWWS